MITPSYLLVALVFSQLPGAGQDHSKLPLAGLPFDSVKARGLQETWGRSAGVDVGMTNSVGMKLVLIPPGRFDMGPNGSTHRVTLTKPFHLGVTEVTLGQYRKFKADHRIPGADDEFNHDDRPAAFVSWNEAQAFCAWLSQQPEEKKAGRVYALPTEAQWEWAARAGARTTRYFGDSDKGQTDFSWFNSTYTPNPKNETKGRGRQPVAKLKPNAFGLYDMLGNVWEWCADRRSDENTGETREPVMRGGSWRSGAFHCTAVAHDPGAPDVRGDHIGFRVACRMEAGKIGRMVFFSGRVQGVGFRATAAAIAKRYPVGGWVKNLEDGRVQLLVEGPAAAVNEFLSAIRTHWGKDIEKADTKNTEPTGKHPGFVVVP